MRVRPVLAQHINIRFAETGGESDLIRLRKVLVAEHEYAVVGKGGRDGGKCGVVEGLCERDALHLRPAGVSRRRNG